MNLRDLLVVEIIECFKDKVSPSRGKDGSLRHYKKEQALFFGIFSFSFSHDSAHFLSGWRSG